MIITQTTRRECCEERDMREHEGQPPTTVGGRYVFCQHCGRSYLRYVRTHTQGLKPDYYYQPCQRTVTGYRYEQLVGCWTGSRTS